MKAKVLLTIIIVVGVIAALFIFNRYRPETKIALQAVAEMEARKNSSTAQTNTKYPDVNLLGKEKSPYLLQHADNPVHWYPWGDEAFAKAKAEDKPIFLSIGYSTCHWCHVMEHESFEDEEVAKLMNDTFGSIKVDREERPDIDNIYMSVCQMLSKGGCGWPLNVIMTPDKKPFFAATYMPKETRFGRTGMLDLVPRIKELWENDREKVVSKIRPQILVIIVAVVDIIFMVMGDSLSGEVKGAIIAGAVTGILSLGKDLVQLDKEKPD